MTVSEDAEWWWWWRWIMTSPKTSSKLSSSVIQRHPKCYSNVIRNVIQPHPKLHPKRHPSSWNPFIYLFILFLYRADLKRSKARVIEIKATCFHTSWPMGLTIQQRTILFPAFKRLATGIHVYGSSHYDQIGSKWHTNAAGRTHCIYSSWRVYTNIFFFGNVKLDSCDQCVLVFSR